MGRTIADLRLELQQQPPRLSYQATGPRVDLSDEIASYEKLVEIWSLGSLQMHRLSGASGIRYLHFLQPNQYVPDSKKFNQQERRQALNDRSPYGEHVVKAYSLLRSAGASLRSEGVGFHDLSMIFSEVSEPIYVDTCCHVNELGNRILGETISKVILENVR